MRAVTDDEETGVRPAGVRDDMLVYDYFKHLTSLCVISLGGVLALADKVPQAGRGKELLVGALVVIGLAAILAFSGTGEIVRSQTSSAPFKRYANFNRQAAPLLLSVGLGMFTYLFTVSLF